VVQAGNGLLYFRRYKDNFTNFQGITSFQETTGSEIAAVADSRGYASNGHRKQDITLPGANIFGYTYLTRCKIFSDRIIVPEHR